MAGFWESLSIGCFQTHYADRWHRWQVADWGVSLSPRRRRKIRAQTQHWRANGWLMGCHMMSDSMYVVRSDASLRLFQRYQAKYREHSDDIDHDKPWSTYIKRYSKSHLAQNLIHRRTCFHIHELQMNNMNSVMSGEASNWPLFFKVCWGAPHTQRYIIR